MGIMPWLVCGGIREVRHAGVRLTRAEGLFEFGDFVGWKSMSEIVVSNVRQLTARTVRKPATAYCSFLVECPQGILGFAVEGDPQK